MNKIDSTLPELLNMLVAVEGILKSSNDLLVIETNLTIFSSSSWVLNFDSSAHLCISMQGLEEVRGLKEGEIILRVSNGQKLLL